MAEYLTNTADLTSVADAIRAKGGTSAQLAFPDGFVSAVQAIKGAPDLQIVITTSAGATVTATKGSKTISGTADASGSCTLIVGETGTWAVTAASGSMSKSIDVVVGSVEATLNLIDPVFGNNDWSTIIAACQSGSVPDAWAVGDSKEMTISNKAYQIDIIGKNHDDYADGSGKAPLTFQMHECYATEYKMNNSDSNTGGWADCLLRTTGGFKTIKSKMPAEVVAAMKEVVKKTAADGYDSTINTTKDTMFLLSEIEVQGTRTHSNAGEGTQYEYYKTAANRVKNDTTWWLRSPRARSSTCFCGTRFDGTAEWYVASETNGVAAAWCF